MDGSQASGLNKKGSRFTHPGAGTLAGQRGTRRGCWVHALISEASEGSEVSPVHRGLVCETGYHSHPRPQTPRAAPVTDAGFKSH